MKYKTILVLIGFLLFVIGLLSLVLSMSGLQFTFMKWLNQLDGLFGFLLYVLMVVLGILLMYISKINWQEEKAELD